MSITLVPMPFISHARRGSFYAETFGIPRNDTGVVDRTAAFQDAIDNCEGELILPAGQIRLAGSALLANQQHGLVIRGQGAWPGNGTEIIIDKADATMIEFRSCLDAGIRDVRIRCAQVPTSGSAIKFTRDAAYGYGSSRCFAERVNLFEVYNGIEVNASTDTQIERVDIRNIYGAHGLWILGTSASLRTDVVNARYMVCDIPVSATMLYGNRGNWASSTAYTSGQIVVANGGYYVCTTSGTSSSTAPSSKGSIGNRLVVDGTATWQYVCRTDHAWMSHDSFAYTVNLSHCRLIGGAIGMRMIDGSVTGSSYPIWLRAYDVDCDHPMHTGISLDRGEDAMLTDVWVSSVQIDNGLIVNTNHRGGLRLIQSEINFCARHGILLQSGPTGNKISASQIGCNGRATTNTYHGIACASTAQKFEIVNNRLDSQPTTTTNDQAYGVLVNSATNNRYCIVNNTGEGNQSGLISDFTSTSTRVVSGNF